MASTMTVQEAYRVLGLDKNATKEDVMRARKELLMKWHPDVANSPDATRKAQEINEAFSVIKDNNFQYTTAQNYWGNGTGYGNPYGQGQDYYGNGYNQGQYGQGGYGGGFYGQGGYNGGGYGGGGNTGGPYGSGGYNYSGRGNGYNPFRSLRYIFFAVLALNIISSLLFPGRGSSNNSSNNYGSNTSGYSSEAEEDFYKVYSGNNSYSYYSFDFSDVAEKSDEYVITAKDAQTGKETTLRFDEDTPVALTTSSRSGYTFFSHMEDVMEGLDGDKIYIEDLGRNVYINQYNYTAVVYTSDHEADAMILYYSTSTSIWK